ncbi:tyrosine--tRNA ligase [Candidatus Peregrinibacteria bacterium]|nr:MAG: tyrosine--tRNA ligase [Candidatus Peregrinibacteria bacterium]
MTDEKAIDRVLNLGVADVIVKEDLKKKLMSGKQLRIKLGIDPTGFDLHLGHMVVVHKLKEFQDLGHQIILLFGNFTGRIGDPTGKNETRPMRTQEELEANAKDYMKQAASVLDVSKVEVRWNAEWLAPLNFADVITLSSQFTVAQMLERDMFQERIKNDQPISMHEFMYPLMQGYDSVALKADVELGGTDQTFNLLAGRTLQKAYGQEPQNILTVPILVGTDGSMKMGKSTGNYIGVDDKPEDMYGKTMSIPDDLILIYFELAGRKDGAYLAGVAKRLKDGENPRNLKMELGYELVKLYKGEEEAKRAEEHFKTVHQKKEIPDEIEEVTLGAGSGANGAWNIVDLISELGLAGTKSKARQLIEGGGVKWEGEKVEDVKREVELTGEAQLLQVGKRNFRRVRGD